MKPRMTCALLTLALLVTATTTYAAEPAPQVVTVSGAWARATPPGTAVAAVYLTLSGGPQADRLVGAATPRAAMTQIHVVSEVDGMARMRPVEGVDVPAHTSVALAPQGTHLMLMNVPQPLVAGERFPLTLQFEQAGRIDVSVEVRAPDTAPPHAH